ncbi:ABC-type nitrate/sulfonate/bicarbonate transport system substrate-binding protein [Constrictibacter sp. MBR-5]|jgi:NitT/TauT family transport system ATP-binding protein|uniref:CmpA/NrtA family ABC transporter substrate-binding protein n=1 Tax=Constrictibacter sp. MBR-5 TaxID=3156467 RepID=UPI003394B0A8
MAKTTVRAGFIPLLDCATLAVACECGFAKGEGIELELIRETSWANIRDRVAVGHFDVAHMLAPIPIAAALGLLPLSPPMVAPMALGLGGNAVTVSRALWREMAAAGADGSGDPARTLAALKAVVEARSAIRLAPLTLAVVFPFSAHNYKLRYWLATGGIHPDRDVRLTVVPPPFMVDALREGVIDGFCVGEPWSSVAADAEVGVVATTSAAIWRLSPEKVLGMRADWASRHPETLAALIRAIHRAAEWCGAPENRSDLAHLLSAPAYLDRPPAILEAGLAGRLPIGGAASSSNDSFLVFSRSAATFPWTSHALWFFSQMVRWGHAPAAPEAVSAARTAYRPDIYRAALAGMDVAIPSVNAKVEGALAEPTDAGSAKGRLTLGPDGFFDGRAFDPDHLEAYIDGFELRTEGSLPILS